jgi:hypothetical protein
MVVMPPIEQIIEDWRIGMLATPPLKCPLCNRITRARYACQWCKRAWNDIELDLRMLDRLAYYSQYDSQTRTILQNRGYMNMRVP